MTDPQFQMVPTVRGSIEVITGSMFSGKTEELIRRLRRAKLAGLGVRIFKPIYDNRYHSNKVVSHNQNSITCESVKTSSEIFTILRNQKDIVSVIGIDEAQFFDPQILEVVQELSRQNLRVIIAGLDMDFLGKPFGPMPSLMAVAEDVTKVRAICSDCGNEATFSYRHSGIADTLVLGAQEHYRPLCRTCFNAFQVPNP
ncbi:MAG: thymidine kinase [Sphingomonadales bacterium]|nr:thymidine kinase [Sphingomonadales bacterium]